MKCKSPFNNDIFFRSIVVCNSEVTLLYTQRLGKSTRKNLVKRPKSHSYQNKLPN